MSFLNLSAPSGETATDLQQTELGRARLVLELKGIGHPISFKTGKRSTWGVKSTGKRYPRTVTKKEHRKWMQKAQEAFESQLICALATIACETRTEQPAPYWTALNELVVTLIHSFDDRWRVVRRLAVDSDPCEPGEEGATITIEFL